jgi:2-iminobutanoate/2-iminopropanoate deaminase
MKFPFCVNIEPSNNPGGIMPCKEKQVVEITNGPKAIGPYSVGVMAAAFVFTSGQLGLDPKTGVMVEGGVEAETRQALVNLKNILDNGNSCLENVVKTTVFMRDMADFAKMNAVYAEFFKENPPARSAVQVAALPKNAAVEIEAIAMLKN